MDNGIFSPNAMSAVLPELAMDLDYIDELLFDGCWLETSGGSEFLNNNSPIFSPSSLFDSSFPWPNFEAPNVESSLFSTTPLPNNRQEERQRSSLSKNLSTSDTHNQNPNDLMGSSDVNKRLWIGPEKSPNPGASVMERLIHALTCIRETKKNKDALIQIWVPVSNNGKSFLSTNNQPYSLDLNEPSLQSYREISVNYEFSTGENSKEIEGLPGRVFKGKVPEWTPDVRFFRSDEYARVGHAQNCGVRGTLALPVFEQGSRICLGVIELVMTTQKMNYRPEIESVCKALEAVDLTTSDVSGNQNVEISNGSYQAALPEILEVFKSACETHNLPLAQTWVPCALQGKSGCRHSHENYIRCVSTVDSACHVSNPQMQAFHEACSEHHLLKGQGIVGQAFTTNQPCFSSDITSFTKTEYPLSHYAKMFNLHTAVAIRLRSIHTGKTDFVLEFFLPVNCNNIEDQMKLLNSLSGIIQKVCTSLRVVTDEELKEEISSKKVLDLEDDSLKTTDHFSFEAASLTNVGKRVARKRVTCEKTITLDVLRQHFAGSLKDAAKSIGVCPTTLKRICRHHGIMRWPSRKIKKVGHSLEKLQRVMNTVEGASGTLQIESFYSKFPELASSPKTSKTSPLSTSKPKDHQSKYPRTDTRSHQPTISSSHSSSCSQSSSSSRCYSSGTQPNPSPLNISSGDDPIAKERSGNNVLKRVRSENEIIHILSDDLPDILPRSQSNVSLVKVPKQESVLPIPKNEDVFRIKVTYGEEKIRFRFQKKWKYEDLRREISRRYGIDDMDCFRLKYLDNDVEWVLLTCDADLDECVDLCGSAQDNTIRLTLSHVPRAQHGTSFGAYSST